MSSHDRSKLRRRNVLKLSGGVLTSGLIAGCTGGDGGDGGGGGDGGDGGDGGGGGGGGGTTTPDESMPSDPDEWRKATAEAADEELDDDDLVLWTSTEELVTLVDNFDFGDLDESYSVLTGSIQPVTAKASDLGQKYARQDAESEVDYITAATKLAQYRSETVTYGDATSVPNFKSLDDNFKLGNLHTWSGAGYLLMYNTERVPDPPDPWTWESLFEDRFHDKEIIIDFTPSIPPVWKILNTQGEDGLAHLAEEQNLTLVKSLLTVFENVVKGKNAVALYDVSTHIGPAMLDGSPVDFARASELSTWTPYLGGMGKNAPHPNAARLFTDMILHDTFQGDIITDKLKGQMSFSTGKTRPPELAESFDGELFTFSQLERSEEELVKTWQEAINAPVV